MTLRDEPEFRDAVEAVIALRNRTPMNTTMTSERLVDAAAPFFAKLYARKLAAEVERLKAYPRRPQPEGLSMEEELEYWRSETLALDTWHDIQNERVTAAEAANAQLRERNAELENLIRVWRNTAGEPTRSYSPEARALMESVSKEVEP